MIRVFVDVYIEWRRIGSIYGEEGLGSSFVSYLTTNERDHVKLHLIFGWERSENMHACDSLIVIDILIYIHGRIYIYGIHYKKWVK